MSSTSKKRGRPTVNRRIHVAPVRRENPDIQRLARALVNLARAQYEQGPGGTDAFRTRGPAMEGEGEGAHAEP